MKKTTALFLGAFLILSVLTGCGKAPGESKAPGHETSGNQDEKLIRVAFQYQQDNVMEIFNSVKKEFEESHSGIKVEFVQQERDLYQSMGLPTLLNGKNTPDIYFEWAGQRLKDRRNEGFLHPVKELNGEWGETFFESAYSGSTFDGERCMVPLATDISVMIWYNKTIFEKEGIEIPETWDEMMVASEKLKNDGYIPFAVGNKAFWPAGNWGGHIISRVVGEQAYEDALTMKTGFNTPDFVKAMDYIRELHDKGYINDDASALTDEEAGVLFYTGEAAMYPLGNWMVSAIKENAPADFAYDYFNLPAIEGGKGDQTSIMGVTTGHVINAKTQNYDAAVEFLKCFSTKENMIAFAKVAYMPPVEGIVTEEYADPLMVKMVDKTMASTKTVVAPPDTGYNLEVANNLYAAISKVLTGGVSSEDALKELDETNYVK